MTKREALLKKLSTYQFAALDLQLFLDTHPNDENTIEKMNMFKMQAAKAKADYESQYGPLQKNKACKNNCKSVRRSVFQKVIISGKKDTHRRFGTVKNNFVNKGAQKLIFLTFAYIMTFQNGCNFLFTLSRHNHLIREIPLLF